MATDNESVLPQAPESAPQGTARIRSRVPRARADPDIRQPEDDLWHQLPRDVSQFVGREAEMRALDLLLPVPETGLPRSNLFIVSGGGGFGKTGLAIHWAHRVKHHFPDGQLYINLQGYGPGPSMESEKVLDGFLRVLGIPLARIPAGPEARSALYRSKLHDKRLLIVLDNAAAVNQVRPLLPGSSTCSVLVTARSRLTSLVAREGALRIDLDVLPPEESIAMLREILGSERVDADPRAAEEVAECCDNLPLALRIAAARMVTHPYIELGDLASELAEVEYRLDMLTDEEEQSDTAAEDQDDTTGVRNAFASSYRALSDEAARAFRLLGLHTGPSLSGHAAAALLARGVQQADRLLDLLAGGHLIEQIGPDKYQFHDLLRAYAAERAREEEPSSARESLERLTRWYLGSVLSAIDFMPRRHVVRPESLEFAAPTLTFTTSAAAVAWCEEERLNLLAAIRQAETSGADQAAWQLALALGSYFNLRKHWADWIETHKVGIQAARRSGDPLGRAWLSTGLGSAYRDLGQLELAVDAHREAAQLFGRIGVPEGVASGSNNMGSALHSLGRLEEALAEYTVAVAIYRETGNDQSRGRAMSNHATVLRDLGRQGDAIAELLEALELLTGDDQHGRGFTFHNLGDAYAADGQFELAAAAYRNALPIRRATDNPWGEARSLCGLGICLRELGKTSEAIDILRASAESYDETSDIVGLTSALHLLGTILAEAGDLEGARIVWYSALEKLELAGIDGQEVVEIAMKVNHSLANLRAV